MTRNLIMGLLLANLLLFVWGRWILAPDADDPRSFGEITEPGLVLARPTGRAGADTGEAADDDAPGCFRLGPFAAREDALAVGRQLTARGLPVSQTSESGQVWVGNWVQLRELPSLEAARQAVDRLIRGGIRDAYIFSRDPTIDVSLGVFRSRQGADDVIRLARKAGYEVETTDRFRDGTEYWVETEVPAGIQPPGLADLTRTGSGEAQIIRVEEKPCVPATDVIVEADNEDDGTGIDDSLESPARDVGSPE